MASRNPSALEIDYISRARYNTFVHIDKFSLNML